MIVALTDYGAGNLASVVKALAAVGATPRVAAAPSDLEDAEALVIPGVGHFSATAALGAEWRRTIRERIDAGVPMLGICLGLQWLFEGSDEAPELDGLGLFAGRSVRLSGPMKVPHVGWNTLDRTDRPSRLLHGLAPGSSAYFTHTFAAPVGAEAVATTAYGVTFASVVERGRVFGTQCHPEKSAGVGLQLLRNFVAVASEAR